jgi:ribosome biogenesis GTPase
MTIDLASLGWDAEFAAGYARFAGPPSGPGDRPARVARVDRGVCTVFTAAGTDRASLGAGLLIAAARDARRLPCVGDWVAVRTWPDRRSTVEAVLPRRTQVVRASADRASRGQVLAANLDIAAVVEPLDPAPDLGRIERLLALACESGARPLVLLTKADRLARPGPVAAQVAGVVGGTEVVVVSARSGTGLERLRQLVTGGGVGGARLRQNPAPPALPRGATLGLLGASGAGKSTLVNALAGATVMATQPTRRADGRGRHTTAYRALIPLPGGGAVLDTPGLRAVGLYDTGAGLDLVFADIEQLATGCRYADCGHGTEPGCAVLAAVATGELSARRMDSWRRLHQELAWERRRAGSGASQRRRAGSGRV